MATTPTETKRVKKYFGRFRESLATPPNLVISQVESFKWLVEKGLKEVFDEFSSIKDFSERKFRLDFVSFELAEPKIDEYTAKVRKLSYEASLKVRVKLANLIMGTEKEQCMKDAASGATSGSTSGQSGAGSTTSPSGSSSSPASSGATTAPSAPSSSGTSK